MKFTAEELFDLTNVSGGRFAVSNLSEAIKFCRKNAIQHYENFPVASIMIPNRIRNMIYPIYAFARIADDISDECNDVMPERRLNALDDLQNLLVNTCKNNIDTTNPIFLALKWVIFEKNIPLELFIRLLTAFRMDVKFVQPQTIYSLIEYCNNSANPIGELILIMFDEHHQETIHYSNKICTGLQLINFWQDLSIDLKKGRCYIPVEYLNFYGLDPKNLLDEKKSGKLNSCITQILNDTKKIYNEGIELINRLKNNIFRFEIALIFESGLRMIQKLEAMNLYLIAQRPKLNKLDYIPILFSALIKHKIT